MENKKLKTGEIGSLIVKREDQNRYIIKDLVRKLVFKNIKPPIKAHKIPFSSVSHPNYVQLRNAITFISASSGFDPIDPEANQEHAYGTTVSFVIWDDLGTGTVIDPPMGFPNWMRRMGINFFQDSRPDLTHTHFDHDVGAIERILEEPVNVHTTDTIMQAFS